jgi:hypothetical protein
VIAAPGAAAGIPALARAPHVAKQSADTNVQQPVVRTPAGNAQTTQTRGSTQVTAHRITASPTHPTTTQKKTTTQKTTTQPLQPDPLQQEPTGP